MSSSWYEDGQEVGMVMNMAMISAIMAIDDLHDDENGSSLLSTR